MPNMAVFYSSLTLWFPGMVLTYFLNDFEMVPVAPITLLLLLLLLLVVVVVSAFHFNVNDGSLYRVSGLVFS
jgi:hypothetical protein